MRFLLLSAVAVLKTLLCKGISLVLLTGWFVRENRTHSAASGTVPARVMLRNMQRALVWIYGIAALLSSAVSCLLLRRLRFRHSFSLSAALFAGGAAATFWRWRRGEANWKLMRLLHRAEQDRRTA